MTVAVDFYLAIACVLLGVAAYRSSWSIATWHDFCALLGMCALWPITIATEIPGWLYQRRWRAENDRLNRDAEQELDGCDCDPLSRTGGVHDKSCPAFALECTCYELTGGHQPGCAFNADRRGSK